MPLGIGYILEVPEILRFDYLCSSEGNNTEWGVLYIFEWC